MGEVCDDEVVNVLGLCLAYGRGGVACEGYGMSRQQALVV